MQQLLGSSPFLRRTQTKTRSVTDDETSRAEDGLVVTPPFTQEQDEAQEVGRTLQESHSQTERKSSKSEGSGEDEDEGRGENSPLLIST